MAASHPFEIHLHFAVLTPIQTFTMNRVTFASTVKDEGEDEDKRPTERAPKKQKRGTPPVIGEHKKAKLPEPKEEKEQEQPSSSASVEQTDRSAPSTDSSTQNWDEIAPEGKMYVTDLNGRRVLQDKPDDYDIRKNRAPLIEGVFTREDAEDW